MSKIIILQGQLSHIMLQAHENRMIDVLILSCAMEAQLLARSLLAKVLDSRGDLNRDVELKRPSLDEM